MTDIIDFGKKKLVSFPVEQELYERLIDLIYEYDGDVSLTSTVGVLDLVKDRIKSDHED
jgi:hypothetical protein